MAFDVFISYSSKDKTSADATCAALESAGIRCWLAPRDIRPGLEYAAGIIEGIDACRVMVLIFSSSANASQQIHREIERAVSKGLTIIPLRIEEIAPTKAMEFYLGAIHWLDALTPPFARHLQRLAETIEANLRVDPAGYAPPVSVPLKTWASQESISPRWKLWSLIGGLVALVLLGAGMLAIWAGPAVLPNLFFKSQSAPQVVLRPDQDSPVEDEATLARGTLVSFQRCSSHSACGPGNVCVDNNRDQDFYCKPVCVSDAQCRPWMSMFPQLRCLEHTRANGTRFAHRVCNDNPSYLR